MGETKSLKTVLLTEEKDSIEVKVGDEICLIIPEKGDNDAEGVINKAINLTGEGPYKLLKIRQENGESYFTYKSNIADSDSYELSSKFFRKFNGSCV